MDMFQDLQPMLFKIISACLAVLFAMLIDLVCGLHKAKQRGEFRSSKGLRMTISKFIHYEGSMLLAASVDFLIYISNLYALFHLDMLVNVPIITCLIGMFLIVIEFHSVREKADQKSKKEIKEATDVVMSILGSDSLKQAVLNAMKEMKENPTASNDAVKKE